MSDQLSTHDTKKLIPSYVLSSRPGNAGSNPVAATTEYGHAETGVRLRFESPRWFDSIQGHEVFGSREVPREATGLLGLAEHDTIRSNEGVNVMQHCDQTCSHCAREFFRWLKGRMAQMSMPYKDAQTTFAAAAATSVRPPNPAHERGN